jgi:hypothetical protein
MNEEQILLQLKFIKEQLSQVLAALRGDPSDENRPGLFLRVDRLEQSKKTHNRILWTIVCGGTTAVATVVAALLIRFLL